MKLITWNCQGAFRKKAGTILRHKPDLLVIQECEHPDKLLIDSLPKKPNDFHWHGDNRHKGIALFSFSQYKFKLLPVFNPVYRYILPFRVSGDGQVFYLLAVWAMDDKNNRQVSYVGQPWHAIHYYSKLLKKPIILAGDFNSNSIWDRKSRIGNHSDVVRKLADNSIHSIYHRHHTAEHGNEKHPTFYLHRKQSKPYHLDYCFASAGFAEKTKSVNIGSYKKWIEYSDHAPLKVTFEF